MMTFFLTTITFRFLGSLCRDDLHVSTLAEFPVAMVTYVAGTTYVANITLTLYCRVSGSNL